MGSQMKRKQFHLKTEDEKVLKELAQTKGVSEAEIVRDAIREYATKNLIKENPLIKMAEEAEKCVTNAIGDLSENHDIYLWEIHENER